MRSWRRPSRRSCSCWPSRHGPPCREPRAPPRSHGSSSATPRCLPQWAGSWIRRVRATQCASSPHSCPSGWQRSGSITVTAGSSASFLAWAPGTAHERGRCTTMDTWSSGPAVTSSPRNGSAKLGRSPTHPVTSTWKRSLSPGPLVWHSIRTWTKRSGCCAPHSRPPRDAGERRPLERDACPRGRAPDVGRP